MPITTPPTIDAAPALPLRTDRATFPARAEDWTAWEKNAYPQVRAVAVNVQANAQEALALSTAASASADASQASANAAQASAATAVSSPGTSATSTSSLAISVGTKSLTLAQTGKVFSVGQAVTIARTSAPGTTRMSGTITAFVSGTGAMDVLIDLPTGTGTHTDWTISQGARSASVARPVVVITTDTTALAGVDYYIKAACILTLPAAPLATDLPIGVHVMRGVVAAVSSNGKPISGEPAGSFDARGPFIKQLTFIDNTEGWI